MDKRYQSAEIAEIWSDRNRNHIERRLWVEVMRAQHRLGVDISEDLIDAYGDLAQSQAQLDPDDEDALLEAQDIAELERETGHDLYARLRWFNESVGGDAAHRGLTSSDITENTQQVQIATSAEALMGHAEQVLRRLHKLVGGHADTPIVARTHGRPAQLTTIGKRAADWMQELIAAMLAVSAALEDYPLRGIKGAVGTNADLARVLLPGRTHPHDPDRLAAAHAGASALDEEVANGFCGNIGSMLSVGQCYPRSADMSLVAGVLRLAAACGTIATAVRLMSALGLVVENPGQHVGSSAMPHKSNPRYSERVCSLQVVARGYGGMLQDLAGFQWLEGDVSTSAARRIALPGLFHTVDSMLANIAWVLDHMQFDQLAIRAELGLWTPEVASGALLAALVEAGVSRVYAHELLRHHYGQIGSVHSDPQRLLNLIISLESDSACPLTTGEIGAVFDIPTLVGAAPAVARALADTALGELLAEADVDWPGDLV